MFIEIYDVCNPYILINRYWFYGVSRISKVWGCVSRAQTARYAKILGVYFLRARFSYLLSLAVLAKSSPGTVHTGLGRGEDA